MPPATDPKIVALEARCLALENKVAELKAQVVELRTYRGRVAMIEMKMCAQYGKEWNQP